ncbi:hypothetical protein jhhlp_000665 [Lomentospora prolificans]|uniref:VOC domain-containing protein n=1 Tax=Lomentospora prolificans TaxID=41688 RepID=A0A2N3NJ21_9PEZI|nr:hypothetical protein jhhlp_000665 [Lomentospora prolificans]
MVHLNVPRKKDIPGPDKRATTFSHIGIIVPDTAATVARREDPEDFAAIQEGMGLLNTLNIFAADPDGNLLEIQPEDNGGLFS